MQYVIYYFFVEDMIKITLGSSITIPSLRVWEGTFSNLCDSLSNIDNKYSKNKTNQPFFCATADYEPLYKHGDNLKDKINYDIIVIDGDSGIGDVKISTEKEIHIFLKNKGLNHIVLSSWSKGYDKKKDIDDKTIGAWRAIIQASGVTSNTLENTSRFIVAEMQEAGLSISYAYENHTETRAWFFGGMRNKDLFECYKYTNGHPLKYVLKRHKVKECEVEDSPEAFKSQKLDEIINILKTGGEGYHPAQNKFSWMMASDGVDASMIKSLLQSFMNDWKNDSNRWTERYYNIEKSVETAYQKIKIKKTEFEKGLEKEQRKDGSFVAIDGCDFDTPPGMMGKITEEVLEKMRYPLKQIAIIGALHSVGTFAGNIYRCRDICLTQKRVLLAKSGVGKNSILAWMNYMVVNANVGLTYTSEKIKLVGNTDYTSSRVLHLELQNFPVKSIITSEAGKVGKSTAGDLARLSRHYLMILGNNFSDVLIPTGMASSKENDAMKPLYNLNLQMLSESVPDSYIENMIEQGDISDGNLSRSELIFIDVAKIKPVVNYNSGDHKVKEEVKEIYGRLFKRFQRLGNKDATVFQSKCIEIGLDEYVLDAYNELELFGLTKSRQCESDFESALWNRRHVKTLKTAMLLAIAESARTDRGTADELVKPVITMEEWKWASHYQDVIAEVLEYKNVQGTFDNMFVMIASSLRAKLIILSDGKNTTYERVYTANQKKMKIITGHMLDKLIYRYKDFKTLVGTIYKGRKTDAIRAFIGYCEQIELLQSLDKEEVKRMGMRGNAYKFNI